MKVIVSEEPLAIVGLPAGSSRALAESGLADPAGGVSLLQTGDEVTLILPTTRAAAVVARFPAAKVEGPFRRITLDVTLPWDVVGFFARVAGALAEAGIVIGALSGFSRDHLLVKDEDVARAVETLSRLEWHPRA